MADAPDRPETPATMGSAPTSWLVRQRRTAGLQLEALSTGAGRHRTERAVALRRRMRLLDAELARRLALR